jgi:preprotein translocase subunit SecE
MFDKTRSFLKETQQELNKVTWPSRQELVGSTIIVIVTTLLLALFVGLIDSMLTLLIRIILR